MATYIHYGEPSEITSFLKLMDSKTKVNWLVDNGSMSSTQANSHGEPIFKQDFLGELWVNRHDEQRIEQPKMYKSFDSLMDELTSEEVPYIEYVYAISPTQIMSFGIDWDKYHKEKVIEYREIR